MDGAFSHRSALLDESRRRLLDEIEHELKVIGGRADPVILRALADVPREEFVPLELVESAYRNTPLPIGQGQTISQPTIVAMMTELLRPCAGDRILEIGTGSGYQAAVLARLVAHVYSIERIEELAETARQRLARLGCTNVSVRCGDGNAGWPEEAPFDGIIVTAATAVVPPKLLSQLGAGGRLVVPLGDPSRDQWLTLIERDPAGDLEPAQRILPVTFVPLIGDR